MSWITESNRWKHMVGGFLLGTLLTIISAATAAATLEFKDCQYANGDIPIRYWSWQAWDWLDFWATIIGGLIGQALQILFIYLVFFA